MLDAPLTTCMPFLNFEQHRTILSQHKTYEYAKGSGSVSTRHPIPKTCAPWNLCRSDSSRRRCSCPTYPTWTGIRWKVMLREEDIYIRVAFKGTISLRPQFSKPAYLQSRREFLTFLVGMSLLGTLDAPKRKHRISRRLRRYASLIIVGWYCTTKLTIKKKKTTCFISENSFDSTNYRVIRHRWELGLVNASWNTPSQKICYILNNVIAHRHSPDV